MVELYRYTGGETISITVYTCTRMYLIQCSDKQYIAYSSQLSAYMYMCTRYVKLNAIAYVHILYIHT